MSSGAFENAFYETNNGQICAVRVQPETRTATIDGNANSGPAGPATQLASANVTADRSGNGVFVRYARCTWDTDPPENYSGASFVLPILDLANVPTGNPRGVSVNYLGTAAQIQTIIPERIG